MDIKCCNRVNVFWVSGETNLAILQGTRQNQWSGPQYPSLFVPALIVPARPGPLNGRIAVVFLLIIVWLNFNVKHVGYLVSC